ncbi:Hypothetical predicted protein [Lecanosticta acicola]|uniref:Uncharacterized protein n=1 Tax=Lecanosticta acicola TaxID=111012 RepID=A0AAI8Z8Q8_9PEZI|nr:Hypothetical predicted protein [Lecanosticta acicola]
MAFISQAPDNASTRADAMTFLQRLAINFQVLSSIQLLSEFQVLACIPPDEAISYGDVAEIVGLPEAQLRAVVRLTASVGFLRTPTNDSMAHNSLSFKFVNDLGVVDAFGFAAETLAPCALRMAEACRGGDNAYRVAFGASSDFTTDVQHRWRMQRQAAAHFRLAKGPSDEDDPECHNLLSQLDWASLADATVVDVGGKSLDRAISLASHSPAVSIMVQSDQAASLPPVPADLASRIHVQACDPSGAQHFEDASVYVMQLKSPTLTHPVRAKPLDTIARQLASHLPILRKNPLTRVVLLARVLPDAQDTPSQDSGSITDISSQSLASYRNLTFSQLTGGRDHERPDIVDIVTRTRDGEGVLAITNEIRSSKDAGLTAFEIQYHRLPRDSPGVLPV